LSRRKEPWCDKERHHSSIAADQRFSQGEIKPSGGKTFALIVNTPVEGGRVELRNFGVPRVRGTMPLGEEGCGSEIRRTKKEESPGA
jgi:hypothetical protein